MTYEPESMWLMEHGVGLHHSREEQRVYVDLGCAHPKNASLTHCCRDMGWRGIAIDGNLDYEKDWEAAGVLNHFYGALLSDETTARFSIHDNCFTSRISPTAETDHPERWGIKRTEIRPCVSLEGILMVRHIEKIDLLTVDLEGHDLKVLKTLNWNLHQPSFVIVEHTAAGESMNHELLNYILDQEYTLLRMFPSNAIFKRK